MFTERERKTSTTDVRGTNDWELRVNRMMRVEVEAEEAARRLWGLRAWVGGKEEEARRRGRDVIGWIGVGGGGVGPGPNEIAI